MSTKHSSLLKTIKPEAARGQFLTEMAEELEAIAQELRAIQATGYTPRKARRTWASFKPVLVNGRCLGVIFAPFTSMEAMASRGQYSGDLPIPHYPEDSLMGTIEALEAEHQERIGG